ncbi:MAG TPA: hypothetical protein VM074_04020, partial [Solimonas sp.]|nr:hypothetical protein [Solimonas sp.]
MSLRLKAGIAGCAFALVLSACSQSPDQSPPKRKPVLTGMFADHPVEGLGFSGSKLTNRQGEFQYRQGESVRFFIGKIVLGSAPGAHAVTPLQLYPGATTAEGAGTTSTASRQATNVARLLITLDADCDETDGIYITPAAREAATGQLNFNQDEASFAADPAVMSYLARAGAQCQMPSGATARGFLADTNAHMAAHAGYANRLPTADAGGNIAQNEGAAVTVVGHGTDDDGVITGYRWTQIGGPQVISGPQSTQNLTFTAPTVAANTVLSFRLRV